MLDVWLPFALYLFDDLLWFVQGNIDIENLQLFVFLDHLLQVLGLSLIFDVLLANLDQIYLKFDNWDWCTINQGILFESIDII